MSGEAVVLTAPVAAVAVGGPILLAAAAIVGTASIGAFAITGVAKGVASIIDNQVEAARVRAVQERLRLKELEAFDQRQQRVAEDANKRHQKIKDLQQRLAQISRQEIPVFTGKKSSARQSEEAISPVANNAELLIPILDEISIALDALPDEIRRQANSPINKLNKHVADYRKRLNSTRPPDVAQILGLKTTVECTVTDYLDRLEAEQQAHDTRIARVQEAINKVLLLDQLPANVRPPLSRNRTLLLNALEVGDISAAQLQEIEHFLQAVIDEAAQKLAGSALRPALAESLLRQLYELQYEVLSPFPREWVEETAIATVRVPDGGQVRIRMDENARLRFQFSHERQSRAGHPMDKAEGAFARQQEARWCQDLKRVVAGLVEEGFESEATFERHLPSIPIVTWVPLSGDTAPQASDDRKKKERRRRALAQRSDKSRSLK